MGASDKPFNGKQTLMCCTGRITGVRQRDSRRAAPRRTGSQVGEFVYFATLIFLLSLLLVNLYILWDC